MAETNPPTSTSTWTSATQTAQLASFLADLSGNISTRLLDLAAGYLLDTTGVMIYGSQQPWSQAAIAQALAAGGDATGRSGPSTVLGAPGGTARSTAEQAAMANGASAHAFELDDVHEEAISHPGAVVIPAALALAEELGCSGADLLEAIVIGYEAMGRAGIAVGPASHMLGGFHPTSMSGVFGSAAAAGRLLGFDVDQMNQAFGLATTFASGTMEFVASGGMAKRIHAGRAAEGGLTAARLVSRGFEGATDGLAGTYGFCRVFTTEPQIDLLTEKLGERWMMDEITIKPYAACSDIHPMIQAAAELRAEHDLTADRIAKIEAFGPTKAATQNSMDGTVSVMAAQYSAQFNIAAAIVADPTDPATYGPDRIADPGLAHLQAKVVSVEANPAFDATYAWKMGGAVRITLTDGTVLERTVHGQKGSMHQPLSTAELRGKFDSLVAGHHVRPELVDVIGTIADRPIEDLTAALQHISPHPA